MEKVCEETRLETTLFFYQCFELGSKYRHIARCAFDPSRLMPVNFIYIRRERWMVRYSFSTAYTSNKSIEFLKLKLRTATIFKSSIVSSLVRKEWSKRLLASELTKDLNLFVNSDLITESSIEIKSVSKNTCLLADGHSSKHGPRSMFLHMQNYYENDNFVNLNTRSQLKKFRTWSSEIENLEKIRVPLDLEELSVDGRKLDF